MKKSLVLFPIFCLTLMSCRKNDNNYLVQQILSNVQSINQIPDNYSLYDNLRMTLEGWDVLCDIEYDEGKNKFDAVYTRLCYDERFDNPPSHDSDYYTSRVAEFLTTYYVIWKEKIEILFPEKQTHFKYIKPLGRIGWLPTIDIEYYDSENEFKEGRYFYYRYFLRYGLLYLESAYCLVNFNVSDEYSFSNPYATW